MILSAKMNLIEELKGDRIMKKQYTSPMSRVLNLNTADVLTASFTFSKNGEGDIISIDTLISK